jgi:hypothetical protein
MPILRKVPMDFTLQLEITRYLCLLALLYIRSVEGVFSVIHLFARLDVALVGRQGLYMLKASQGEGVEGLPRERVQQLVSMR